MTSATVSTLWLRLLVELRRLGWVKLVLLIGCTLLAAVWLWFLPALRTQVQGLHEELSDSQAEQTRARQRLATQIASTKTENGVTDLQTALGDRRLFGTYIADFMELAQSGGLQVTSVDYRVEGPKDGAILRQSLSVPLRGTYAQLRQLIDNVLLLMPFVALDSLDVRRDKVASDAVEANLNLSMYLRDMSRAGMALPPAGSTGALPSSPP